MRNNICFISNAYKHLFPSNTSTKFRSSIDLSRLDYLSTHTENLEFCIKSISFFLDTPITSATHFGVRTSLCLMPIVCGSYYDNVVCMFTIERILNPTQIIITLNNPIFHSTTKNLISQAQFEILNLETNTIVSSSSIKETIIEVSVRSSSFDRMKQPFPMLLHSDDIKSLVTYPNNTNMKFTINLPARKELGGENWSVVLKGLTMTSSLANVQDESFFVTVRENVPIEVGGGIGEMRGVVKTFVLPPGFYSNKREMFRLINEWLRNENIKITLYLNKNNRVGLRLTDTLSNIYTSLQFSPLLSLAFGFDVNFIYTPFVTKYETAPSVGNLNIGIPSNIILKCDLIANITVGIRKVKMLRHISNFTSQLNNSIINFQFKDLDPCMLEIRSFSKIQFEFCSIDEKPLLARNDHPSFIHILFVNLDPRS